MSQVGEVVVNGDAVWWFGLVESSNSFTLQELQEGSIEVYREIGKREKGRERGLGMSCRKRRKFH